MDETDSRNPAPEEHAAGETVPDAESAHDESAGKKTRPAEAPPAESEKRIPEMVKGDLRELTKILSENPHLENQIRELFERHLMQGLSRETYERLVVSLQVLLGASASRIIVESTKVLTSEFFTELRQSEEPPVEGTVRFLQHLTALYGTLMKDAFLLSFKYTEEDWRTAEVVAYHKGDSDIWFVELDLMKYNGERFFLRMSPFSAFQLLQTFINEMGKLPENTVDQQVMARFRESAARLRKKYGESGAGNGEGGEAKEPQLDGYA
jgi:hypothetical protein